MIEYFDSHCHLTDAAFRDDREAVVLRARDSGVTRIVTIASTLPDTREALALARRTEGVWCTAGVHPHEAAAAGPDDLDAIRELATGHADVVAIGETGLDFHYDNSPRSVQQELFEAHLALAADVDRPVVVHARQADPEIASALRRMRPGTRGVLHCFSGGARAFEEAMAAGWYVSLSGIASFKGFEAVDLLREVPPDRLLVETDSPYLAPVPKRGRRNEPSFVIHVVDAVAAHLGAEAASLAHCTTENACRFYGID